MVSREMIRYSLLCTVIVTCALSACSTQVTRPVRELPQFSGGTDWFYVPSEANWQFRVQAPDGMVLKTDTFVLKSGAKIDFITTKDSSASSSSGALNQIIKDPPKDYSDIHTLKIGDFQGVQWREEFYLPGCEKYFFSGKGHGINVLLDPGKSSDLSEAQAVLKKMIETIEFAP